MMAAPPCTVNDHNAVKAMTMPTNTKPTLVGISGSLRGGSYNTIILETLATRIEDRATLRVWRLNDMPSYDQDLDTDVPPQAVADLRRAVLEADGVVIATPEYNYGLPGVLKNALDWLSRPHGKSAFIAKPVLTMTSSPAFTGGARAQAQLHDVLTSMAALIVLRPQAVIPAVHTKIADSRLVDVQTLRFLDEGIADLLRNVRSREAAVNQEA